MIAAQSLGLAAIATAAIGPIAMVLVTWLMTRRKLEKQDKALREIHVLVNSRLQAALDRLAELESWLAESQDEVQDK